MKVTAPTALLSVQAAAVLAAPFADKNALVARQGGVKIYENADGFATVEYGDGRLNYGDRLPSSVLDIIKDECAELSCSPSGGFGFTARVINSDRPNDVSYTVSVEGSFAAAGERANKEQLLELAKMAFQEVYNSGVATLREDVKYITGECPAWATNGCAGKFIARPPASGPGGLSSCFVMLTKMLQVKVQTTLISGRAPTTSTSGSRTKKALCTATSMSALLRMTRAPVRASAPLLEPPPLVWVL
jgi:hypothetical protein